MSLFQEQILEAIAAAEILERSRYSWFRSPSPNLARRVLVSLSPDATRQYLVLSLQRKLYTDFYCPGYARPPVMTSDRPPRKSGDPSFTAALSRSNCGTGYWDEGWTIYAWDAVRPVLEKNGTRFRADVRDCAPEGSMQDARDALDTQRMVGARVSLRFPPELRGVSPGFYMAVSDTPLPRTESLTRVYWNVSPEGAVHLMEIVTTEMNRDRIPFRFKALNDPRSYSRCDAAVLYVEKSQIRSILPRLYARVERHLDRGTPALTKCIAPGLSLAEDPADGGSFGMSRSGLIAEGLVRAFEERRTASHERLAWVARCFDDAGVDIERPYATRGTDESVFQIRLVPGRPEDGVAGAPSRGASPSKVSTLETASRIGRELCAEAIWVGDQCSWVGPTFSSLEHGLRMSADEVAALGPDVYSGTAGIAFFLAELSRVDPDPIVRRTACGAVRHALARVTSMDPQFPGFHAGWTGPALVSARVGLLLGEESFLEATHAVVTRFRRGACNPRAFDIVSGRAGAICALLAMGAHRGGETAIDLAGRFGRQLLRAADRPGAGMSWKWPGSSGPGLTGFSHGASGIGIALMEWGRAAKDETFIAAGQAAFDYERGWYNADEQNWPDLRWDRVLRRSNGSRPSFASFWCHGAPGIALARIRAFELTGERINQDEAEIALGTTRRAIEIDLNRKLWEHSLCHGLAGKADILLEGQRSFGTAEGRTLVQEAAGAIAREWRDGEERRRELLSSDVPKGLMLGAAGIGYFLLRSDRSSVPSILLLRGEALFNGEASDRSSRSTTHPSQDSPRC